MYQAIQAIENLWNTKKNMIFRFSIFTLVGVSIFFRFYNVTNYPPLHPDEPRMNLPGVVWDDRDTWINFWNAESRIGTDPIILWTSVFLYEKLGLEPSTFLVRFPALFYNCLLILLAFLFLPKIFRRDIGWLMTLLIAVHPLHIKLSRYGYDPSHTPFIAFLVLLFALQGYWIFASLAYYVAVMTHPANVFLGPIFVAAFFWRDESKPLAWGKTCWWRRCFVLFSLIISAGIVWQIFQRWVHMYPWQVENSTAGIFHQLQSLNQFTKFWWHTASVLSGASASLELQSWLSYENMWPASIMAKPAVIIIVITLLMHLFIVRRKYCIPISIIFASSLFYLFTSDRPYIPTYERFLIWIIIPVLLWSVWVWWKTSEILKIRYLTHIAVFIISIFMLFAFQDQYFLRLRNKPAVYDLPAQLELLVLSVIEGTRDHRKDPVIVTNWKKMHWGTCYFIHREEYSDYSSHLSADPRDLPSRCMIPNDFSRETHQVFVIIRADDPLFDQYKSNEKYKFIWHGWHGVVIYEYMGDFEHYIPRKNQWIFG